MAVLFLLLYPLTVVLCWFVLAGGLKKLLKERYKTRHAAVAFAVLTPFLVLLLGYAAVGFLPFPGD